MKTQLEERQTRTKFQKEQQAHGFISIIQGINTKSLPRHGIRKTIQTNTKLH